MQSFIHETSEMLCHPAEVFGALYLLTTLECLIFGTTFPLKILCVKLCNKKNCKLCTKRRYSTDYKAELL